MECTCEKGGGALPKSRFRPKYIRSFQHLTVHNDGWKDQHKRSTANFNFIFTYFFNNILYAGDGVVNIMLDDGWVAQYRAKGVSAWSSWPTVTGSMAWSRHRGQKRNPKPRLPPSTACHVAPPVSYVDPHEHPRWQYH